jgi:hypothetical protein
VDKDELIRALRDSLAPASENYSQAAEKTKSLGLDETFFIRSIAEPIAAALSAHPPFDGGAGFLVESDSGYTGFYAGEAARVLSRKVLAGETPKQAVAWLEKVLSADEARGRCILSIFGVEIASPVDLGQEVTLLPFQSLPESSTKAWLSHPPGASISPGYLLTHAGSPRAALMTTHTVRPLLHPTKKGEPPKLADPFRARSLLDDARLALTLVGPSSPAPGGYWFEFEDRDLSDSRHYGGVLLSNDLEEVTPFAFSSPTTLDPEDARRVASTFLALDEPLRSKLRLALRRLNQAIRRPPHGDRALDLAISLESLLGDRSPGETTYKLALRAALVLDVPLERRREVRGIVDALYDLRSRLAHDGYLPPEKKVKAGEKQLAPMVIDTATTITTEVLRAILHLGSIPDWFEFELTGGRGSTAG